MELLKVLAFMALVLAALYFLLTNSSGANKYNEQVCKVYGYESDCSTRLKGPR